MRITLKKWWTTILSYLNPEDGQPTSVIDIQKAILRGLGRSGTRTLRATVIPGSVLVFLSEEARRVLRPQQTLALREVQDEFLALAKREGWVVPPAGPSLRIVTDSTLTGTQVRVTALGSDVTAATPASDVTTLRPVEAPAIDAVWLSQVETGQRWDLPLDRYSILGKTGTEADLQVASVHVSRAHLLLTVQRDSAGRISGVRAEDLGSTHGTWVSNDRLAAGQLVDIRHGDIIRVADVNLRLSISGPHSAKRTGLAK